MSDALRHSISAGEALAALIGPVEGLRLLDLGCHDGAVAARLVARGARVEAVEWRPAMAMRARARGLTVHLAPLDAPNVRDAEFDVVFSHAALHWWRYPAAVLAQAARALRPGGRVIGDCGGFGNAAAIRTALHAVLRAHGQDPLPRDPWHYPDEATLRQAAAAAGLVVTALERVPRITPLATDMAGWIDAYADWFTEALPAAHREAAIADVTAALAPALRDAAGHWWADHIRLRFLLTR